MKNNLLLLTGWGATCKAWEPIIPALQPYYHIHCAVPAWLQGNSLQASLGDFDHYIETLAKFLQMPTDVLAWSLGGLVAIHLATRFPGGVNNIIFLSSVPKFVALGNCDAGIDYQWFKKFKVDFDRQPQAMLKKFLALQAKGDEASVNTLRALKKYCPLDQYDLQECKLGLELLEQQNLTSELAALQPKSYFIHGDHDAVVSMSAAQSAALQINAEFQIVQGAGHAPHISHPQQTVELIKKYLSISESQ